MTDISSLYQDAPHQLDKIERELEKREFYGLANARIAWLLDYVSHLETERDELAESYERLAGSQAARLRVSGARVSDPEYDATVRWGSA